MIPTVVKTRRCCGSFPNEPSEASSRWVCASGGPSSRWSSPPRSRASPPGVTLAIARGRNGETARCRHGGLRQRPSTGTRSPAG
ncbi:hypothetical protein QJS66_09870 [Kocuria rhizophila]|nr:hypothetical protein QJS66_09870 [Kocuria rhizophila]